MCKTKIKKFGKRLVIAFAITIILFVIGLCDYFIGKTFEIGIYALPLGIILVWIIILITGIDKIIYKS